MTIIDHDSPLRARLRGAVDRFRGSLFGVPALWIAAAVLVALASVEVDIRLDDVLPDRLTTTSDSARALLSAISTGTIAAASVVFSLTLVSIQLATSAYSSRVLRTFLRDRVQQHVIGLLTATFTYSMLVLREVGDDVQPGATFVPRIAVLVAATLAVASMLGLITSINRTAQSLRATSVTRQLVADGRRVIDEQLPLDGIEADDDHDDEPEPGSGEVVAADRSGWVQQIATDTLDESIDPGATVRLEVAIGDYVAEGSPLLTVWPAPQGDAATVDRSRAGLRETVIIGGERTLQQDVRFALVMVEDIALRALSPGIDDSNTVRAVLPQLGELVLSILERPARPVRVEHRGYHVLRPAEPDSGDHVQAAFDQIRVAAADRPFVLRELVDVVATIGTELLRRDRMRPAALAALRGQLALVDRHCATRDDDPDHVAIRERIASIGWHRADTDV